MLNFKEKYTPILLFWTFHVLIVLLSFNSSPAQGNNSIYFNFAKQTISVQGTYHPANDGKRSGLEAETIARKKAIANLKNYFEQKCVGKEKFISLQPQWEQNLRSQGTEIFPHSISRITLSAGFDMLFKYDYPLTETGKQVAQSSPLIFEIPVLTHASVDCGFIPFNIPGEETLYLYPFKSVPKSDKYHVLKTKL
ncbi:MAG: hypothetical protein K2X39_06655, partial [Silvanigrellaceae bacterium]|nr:hypothetical protein [Silvanigrellaceae bacterium]